MKDEYDISFKALPIFSTMRSNLAMVDAFSRRTYLEVDRVKDDLGFLGIKPGKDQRNVHNQSVATILTALMYQVLENYLEMKEVKHELEDSSVEQFFSALDEKDQFIKGMRLIRNNVFHVPNPRHWKKGSVIVFNNICNQRGGVLAVMDEMKKLFYEYTEKCFSGELRIWPDKQYETMKRLEKEEPDFMEKWVKGELNPISVGLLRLEEDKK